MNNYLHQIKITPSATAKLFPRPALAALLAFIAGTPISQAGPYDAWRYSKSITMNTAASGPGISSTLQNYPLAIRLNSDNFDFSGARSQGKDIRFAAADGSALPYEIDFWDRDGQKALVWVKTTVLQNNDTQQVIMYWGKEDADSENNPQKVFDTENGWVGVYHLNEPASNDDGNFKDATPNAGHGTGQNMKATDSEDGVLGGAIRFVNSRSNGILVSGVKSKPFQIPEGDWSISIWGTKDGLAEDKEYQTMMCMGDDHWNLQRWGTRHVFESCAKIKVAPWHCCPASGYPYTDVSDEWYHIAAKFKRDKSITMYLNGKQYDYKDAYAGTWALHSRFPFSIGTQTQIGNRTWSGRLDEARVINRYISPDWAKLDYHSQKPGSSWLVFGQTKARRGARDQ